MDGVDGWKDGRVDGMMGGCVGGWTWVDMALLHRRPALALSAAVWPLPRRRLLRSPDGWQGLGSWLS